jgi:hypothetical protein
MLCFTAADEAQFAFFNFNYFLSRRTHIRMRIRRGKQHEGQGRQYVVEAGKALAEVYCSLVFNYFFSSRGWIERGCPREILPERHFWFEGR